MTSTPEPEKPKLKGAGGAGRGQGRKPGSKNKAKSELEKAMGDLLDKKIAAAGGKGIQTNALELLQELYLSKKTPFIIRKEAMKAALPYEAAKLQPVPPIDDPLKDKPFEHRMSDARRSLLSKLTPSVQPAAGGELPKHTDS